MTLCLCSALMPRLQRYAPSDQAAMSHCQINCEFVVTTQAGTLTKSAQIGPKIGAPLQIHEAFNGPRMLGLDIKYSVQPETSKELVICN